MAIAASTSESTLSATRRRFFDGIGRSYTVRYKTATQLHVRGILLSLTLLTFLAALSAPANAVADKAAFKVLSASLPTHLAPGSKGSLFLVANNLGAKVTEGPITLTDEVPAGFEVLKDEKGNFDIRPRIDDFGAAKPGCAVSGLPASGQTVTCATGAIGSGDITAGSKQVTGLITTTGVFTVGSEIQGTGIPAATTILKIESPTELTLSNAATLTAAGVALTAPTQIHPGNQFEVRIFVKAPALAVAEPNEATISGGGAEDASTTSPIVIDSLAPPFGFLPGTAGLDAPFTDADGQVVEEAGSHPYQLTVDLGFPTKLGGNQLVSAGTIHDVTLDLPRGVVINPAATPVLCTEAQLMSDPLPGCPDASQVGTVSVIGVAASFGAWVAPIFNMVPPPGEAAALGFDALGVGIFPHVLGELRSDDDYGLSGNTTEVLALPAHPIFGARTELWGDPSDESHARVRGFCAFTPTPDICPYPNTVPDTDLALLTLPGECPQEPLLFKAFAHSWEERDVEVGATYEGADLAGDPSEIKGCDQLDFQPTFKARPTTNLADSPSGFEAELTQELDLKLTGKSPSPLKDAVVTLPAGLVANASQADGLAACSPAQIGMRSGVGESPVRLSKDPDNCPDASKIGTVEVQSPLLAQRSGADENKVVLDADNNPVPRPVKGALYVAKPFENPFNSLLAIYISVNDESSGVVAKLAGRVEPDPASGQLTTRFTENPQLPLSEVRVKLFAGSRAPLVTPPTCGEHATASVLTPWSSPQGAAVAEKDSFQITSSPAGGCPASEAAAPNAPAFNAGTLTPKAGAFSPLRLKLTRSDGSQRMAKLDLTLPSGLSARLAGVAQCSEGQIAAAATRSAPEEGKLEQAAPSCPASSELGIINAGAGAGPTPLHIQGRAYLAGPYKGAPLSVVAITPAVAGPFDLGVVVVRSALYLDPTTAQGRAVSDPFPQILHGIPANLRSVALHVTREPFTLNPTSCDPKSFAGAATSALGQIAPLADRFQVGDCDSLPFKPKLSMRLFGPTNRGAHPRFRAILTAKGGEANIARTVVTLPRSEFIDQAHFQTICTRVQYAANQCPPRSIYGFVKATSPLLDYPVQGPIYLRSSSQELPDVVLALRGPAHQPIAIDAVGHVDSVKGRLRTTFETIPDAPISKAIITLRGASKGLFQNSTNICRKVNRAAVKMDAHNGKVHDIRPPLKASCKGKAGRKGKGKGAKGKAGRR